MIHLSSSLHSFASSVQSADKVTPKKKDLENGREKKLTGISGLARWAANVACSPASDVCNSITRSSGSSASRGLSPPCRSANVISYALSSSRDRAVNISGSTTSGRILLMAAGKGTRGETNVKKRTKRVYMRVRCNVRVLDLVNESVQSHRPWS